MARTPVPDSNNLSLCLPVSLATGSSLMGTQGAACSAHEVVMDSDPSSRPPRSISRAESPSEVKTCQDKGTGESPGSSLSSGESLLIMCGCGLLGHLHLLDRVSERVECDGKGADVCQRGR